MISCVRAFPVLLIVLVGGCPGDPPAIGEGEGEGEGEGDRDDPDVLDVVQLAEANAAFALRCQTATFQAELDPAFDAAVIADEDQLFERFRVDLNALAGDPLISVNLSRVNECLDFLADATSPCAVASEQPGESCRGVFVGQVSPDGVCARAEQCAFGFGCTAGAEQCGTCVQRSGDGRPCNPGGCLPGLACVPQGDTPICSEEPPPALAVDDPCVDDVECGQALVTGLVCRGGACAALQIVAAANTCDSGVFVGAGLRVCEDGLTLNRCDDDDEDGEGTCVARGGVGGGCSGPSECNGLEAFCNAGTCAATGVLNDACDFVPGGDPPCTRSLSCEGDVCLDSLFLPPASPACDG